MCNRLSPAIWCRCLATAFLVSFGGPVQSGPTEREDENATGQRFEDEFALDSAKGITPAIHPTRLDYSEFDSPEAVTVITQERIRLAGYLEVSEIFRGVPGFRIVKVGDITSLSYHGTSAFENRRAKVTIDGRSVLIGDGAYVEFDRLPIDLEDIARVTITRGPNGAALGDNAFLVSIDFETINKNDPHGIGIRVGGGYSDREKVGITVNESVGGAHVSFSAGSEKDGGYEFADSDQTPRNDGKKIDRARLTIDRTFGAGSTWMVDASIYDSEHILGFPAPKAVGDRTNNGQFFSISNRRELGETSRLDWFISHNAQEDVTLITGCLTPETVAATLSILTVPDNEAALLSASALLPQVLGVALSDVCFFNEASLDSDKTDFEIEYESQQGPIRYLVGTSASKIEAHSDQWFSGSEARQATYRAFAETAYRRDKFHYSAGLMLQDSDNVDSIQTAWRGAINWQVQPSQMLRYSYTNSFRVPSLVETDAQRSSKFFFGRRGEDLSTFQFGIPVPFDNDGERIKPETIGSHAIGYFGTFLNARATVDFKVFDEHIRDPVRSVSFASQVPPANNESFRLRGAETEFSYRFNEWFNVVGHYSYLDNDSDIAFQRGLHGKHAGSLSLTWQLATGHALTGSYYGNSSISGNTYDRFDVVYNFKKLLGGSQLKTQLIFQHHVGGVDGISNGGDTGPDEGHFKHLNQAYLFLELVW